MDRRYLEKNYLYTDFNSKYTIILYCGMLVYIPLGIRDFWSLLSQEEVMINIATLFYDDDIFESLWYYYGSIFDVLHIVDVKLLRKRHLQHFISWLLSFRYSDQHHVDHGITTLMGASWTVMSTI